MSDVVERLRAYPAVTDGDALAVGTVCAIMEEAAAEITRLRAQVASLKEPLQPTDEDRRLASVVREVATEREDMDLYIAANRLEQGQYYDCGDFGLVIENQDLCAQVASLTAAVEGGRELRELIAAAYQIVGTLAHTAGLFDHPSVTRALDALSNQREDEDMPLLPFPHEPFPAAAAIREGGDGGS